MPLRGGDSRRGPCRTRKTYWRPRLDALVPTAFGLEEITPTAKGIELDYLSHEGKPIHIVFTFSAEGKIRQTSCAPA